MTWKLLPAALVLTAGLGAAVGLHAQQPPAQAAGTGAQDQVAALKQSMQQGLAKLRQYRVGRDHRHQHEGRGEKP